MTGTGETNNQPLRQEDLLADITRRRLGDRERPVVRYACGLGASGGRGDCTMLEVWASKMGHIVFHPEQPAGGYVAYGFGTGSAQPIHLFPKGPDGERLPKLPARARLLDGWLKEVVEATGSPGVFLYDALSCKHVTCDLAVARLRADVAGKVGTVRVVGDTPTSIIRRTGAE